MSLTVVLGPIARLFTRQMYFFIQLRSYCDIRGMVYLSHLKEFYMNENFG